MGRASCTLKGKVLATLVRRCNGSDTALDAVYAPCPPGGPVPVHTNPIIATPHTALTRCSGRGCGWRFYCRPGHSMARQQQHLHRWGDQRQPAHGAPLQPHPWQVVLAAQTRVPPPAAAPRKPCPQPSSPSSPSSTQSSITTSSAITPPSTSSTLTSTSCCSPHTWCSPCPSQPPFLWIGLAHGTSPAVPPTPHPPHRRPTTQPPPRPWAPPTAAGKTPCRCC